MIEEHISFGFDYNTNSNTLSPNPTIINYGFFSTFNLLLTAVISTYAKYNKLPEIDGKNILGNLNADPEKDMYKHFFEIDDSIKIPDHKNVTTISPDCHHMVYTEDHLKIVKPFFDRYFKPNHHIHWKINNLISKYEIDPDNSLSVIIRGTDKWTDFGGFITMGPGTYSKMTQELINDNPNIKVLVQSEHKNIVKFFKNKFTAIFFEETKTTDNADLPIFLNDIDDKLDWAEWYVASLWVHARSKYIITYSGNSSYFVYLIRGYTKNFYQEIAFLKPVEEYFIHNAITDYGITNLKMSYGEIIDRYTICLLKQERLNLDLSGETKVLFQEINKLPQDIKRFVDDLKEINGKIWDLEADIRKGKEGELGNEEVGIRAIKIRNLNNQRVEIKNKINSITESGFIDTKGSHASANNTNLVISLTTVPERLNLDSESGLQLCIQELCEQNDDGYEVHFNIPHTYAITGEEYNIPDWLTRYQLKYPHLKVFRVDDEGPPTKLLPTLRRVDGETIILVVDDDLIYHRDMVTEHKKWQEVYPDSAIVYEGRGSDPYYEDIRDSWVLCVTRVTEVHGLQHYKSASYKAKLFTEDFWNYYVGKTLSDDILVGRYLRDSDIKMFSVPYEPEVHLYETRELWDEHQGVTTFPIIRYADSVQDTGCNKKELLEIEPKFYEPADLGLPNAKNNKG